MSLMSPSAVMNTIRSRQADANLSIPSGQAFEPEAIRDMSLALESVCETLGLRIADDPVTRLVAAEIIELAQRGVRDVATPHCCPCSPDAIRSPM